LCVCYARISKWAVQWDMGYEIIMRDMLSTYLLNESSILFILTLDYFVSVMERRSGLRKDLGDKKTVNETWNTWTLIKDSDYGMTVLETRLWKGNRR